MRTLRRWVWSVTTKTFAVFPHFLEISNLPSRVIDSALIISGTKIGEGSILKDRPLRKLAPVDYKAMHAGRRPHEERGKIDDDVISGDSLGSPVGAIRLAVEAEEAAGVDLGHENDREKLLSDLDREIEELGSSLSEINSQLKQASLEKRKEAARGQIRKVKT